MFALIAGQPGRQDQPKLEAMAQALRGSPHMPKIWWDSDSGVGCAAAVPGTLPEDAFDRQPIVDPQLAFVAQVRLDNRDEILDRLAIPSPDRAAMADSEVLYHAYRAWGQSCMQHLCGDYAFCALHRDSGRLFAATDHLGTGKLFYAQCVDGLILSTQMRSLLAHPEVPHLPDVEALALLVLPKTLDESTSIAGVKLLRGGHCFIYEHGRIQLARWWKPEEIQPSRIADPRECLEQANAIFARVVQAQLRATGGVSVMMSGGLDSTLVAGVAASQLRSIGHTLTAYTSAPEFGLACEDRPNWDDDESGLAAEMSRLHSNMRHHVVRPEGRCALDVLPLLHHSSVTSVRNTANHIWTTKITELSVAAGNRVILHGGRGNATTSMSGTGVIHVLFRWGSLRHAASLAMSDQRLGGQAAWRTLAGTLVSGTPRRLLDRLRGRSTPLRPGTSFLSDEFLATHASLTKSPAQNPPDRKAMVNFMSVPNKMWGMDSMAHYGVEMRDPTADRQFMEALLAFPLEAFMAGGRSRGLAREMAAGLVPDSIRLRRRRGAQSPEMSSLIAAHAASYRTLAAQLSSSAVCSTLFRLKFLREAIDLLASGKIDNSLAMTIDRVMDVGSFLMEHAP